MIEMHPSAESDPREGDTLAEVSDTELLARLRAGENAAFGELYRRHAGVVRRSVHRLARDGADADDVTAEAFFRVLQAVRRGNGPHEHARTYLLTVARRISWEWTARSRDVPVDDEELNRRFDPEGDRTARGVEQGLIARAFSSLPERWRTVLWHVEVEGERPAVVAPRFGLSPNATAALARRAREGLRAAYLQAHVNEDRSPADCRSVVTRLGAYAAGHLKGAEAARISVHLRSCPSCTALHAELRDVSSTLRTHTGLPLSATGAALAGHQLAGHQLAGHQLAGHQLAGHQLAGMTTAGGVAAAGKGFLLGMRIKLALSAVSAAAACVFGFVGPFHGDASPAMLAPTINSDGGHSLVHHPESATVPDPTVVSPAHQVKTGAVDVISTVGDSPPADGAQTQASNPAGSAAEQPHGDDDKGGCGSDCAGRRGQAEKADKAVSSEDGESGNGEAIAHQLRIRPCAGGTRLALGRPLAGAGSGCAFGGAGH